MAKVILLATALFASQTLPALAEGQLVAVPAADHLLAFMLPEGFVAVSEGEIVARRAGETAENWTEMLTLTVDPERADKDPSMDASILGGLMQERCPDTLEQGGYGSWDIPGTDQGAYSTWNSCGTVIGSDPPRSEQHFSIAISGPSGGYILTRIVLGPASDEGLSAGVDELDAEMEKLTTGMKVCEVTPGEAAPYPSCIGG